MSLLAVAAAAALGLALVAAPALAADQAQLDDLAGCSGATDPDCSLPPSSPPPPGGGAGGGGTLEAPKLIAWTSAYDINPFNGSKGGIFISFSDGSAQRRLTEFANGNKDFTPHGLNAPDDHPSFSPDGRKIVFTSNRLNSTNWDIYVMNVNGTNPTRLTTSSGLDTEPVFSPDGSLIVFSSERSGNTGSTDLWTMRADGTNERHLFGTSVADLEPAWRPDGNQIAFTRSAGEGLKDVFTINVSRPAQPGPLGTDDLTVIANSGRQLTFAAGEDHDATYSPDGLRVVFTTEREPFDPPFGNTHKLRLSDLADEGDLTNDLDLAAGDPFWSFDGARIAFFKSSTRFIHSPQQVWIMAANGTQKNHLPGGSGVANVHPALGRVADANGNSTADYLESGSVGRPTLDLPTRVRPGRRFHLRLGWRHPLRWKLLRTEQLAVTFQGSPVGLVRFDVPSRLFFLWDSSRGLFGAHGRAGQQRTLREGALSLDLDQTRVINVSRRKLVLDLALAFDRRARGVTLGLEARADDARGDSQQDRRTRAHIRVADSDRSAESSIFVLPRLGRAG